MAPSHPGTLSWQRRPLSRGFTGAGSSSLSGAATEDSSAKTMNVVNTTESAASRSQIARSLASKEPGWFQQTDNRGQRSPAYRKSQGNDQADAITAQEKIHLPGLSREPSLEPEKQATPPRDRIRTLSPPSDGLARRDLGSDDRNSNVGLIPNVGSFRSPLPTLSSQRFELSPSQTNPVLEGESSSLGRTLAMSPSQGRISPERKERTPSPTKGLGGFVQSAMLKRSDSVNKRWSAQATSGLSRGDSIVSNRSGLENSRQTGNGTSPPGDSRPSSLSRDNSPQPISRSGSSYNNTALAQSRTDNERMNAPTSESGNKPPIISEKNFVRPGLSHHKRSPSIAESHGGNDEVVFDGEMPASPSKRWSPSKASWLESAIKKPDSPRFKGPAPQQPSWLANISKAKQERGDAEPRKATGFKEASIGSVRASNPQGRSNRPQSVGGVPRELLGGVGQGLGGAAPDTGHRTKNPINTATEAARGDLDAAPEVPTTPSSAAKLSPEIKKEGSPQLGSQSSSTIAKDTFRPNARIESPPLTKPKPLDLSKKDFRPDLKPRAVTGGKKDEEEMEFRNVFGKLRRTQTQNYVAPDELKDNILKGKAGLAVTGGPKKSEHKDEFKESILQRKEAMKAGVTSNFPLKPSSGMAAKGQDSAVPEAIAKRQGLMRPEAGPSGGSTKSRPDREHATAKSESTVGGNQLRDTSEANPPHKPFSIPQKDLVASGTLRQNFNSTLAGMLSKGPSPASNDAKINITANANASASVSDGSMSTATDGKSTNAPQLIHMTKSRARGPKRRLPATETDSTRNSRIAKCVPDQLHQKQNVEDVTQSSSGLADRSESRPLADISNNNVRKPSQPMSPRKPSTTVSLPDANPVSPTSRSPLSDSSQLPAKASPPIKPKPSIKVAGEQTLKASLLIKRPAPGPSEKPQHAGEPPTSSYTPSRRNGYSKDSVFEEPRPLVKDRTAALKEVSPEISQIGAARPPAHLLPARNEENIPAKARHVPPDKPEQPLGLAIHTASEESQRLTSLDHNLPSPPTSSSKATFPAKWSPRPGNESTATATRMPSSNLTRGDSPHVGDRPTSPTSQAKSLLTSLYGEIPRSSPSINLETPSILASSSSNDSADKIKTLRKQMWEITGHGKTIAVPSFQEHILFEDHLYLCVHVFGTFTGTRTTEIYLWCGSGVAQSAAEDAQLFARKVAKENNGRLLILPQGKETPNFFQALGGIVITRRGSSSHGGSPSKSAATYMLCGRRHLGQIAFDEVDFSTRSLCKGFPFIISARFGKLYLWKGSGSGADELGCARLIGMDLGLTGEIEEIDEGREPDSFWESLPGAKPARSASDFPHWHLRPTCEKYITRLFSVDVELSRPKSSSGFSWRRRGSAPTPSEDPNSFVAQIREISPFTQSDLSPSTGGGIYVLDAFFEIYM